jgi:hypothetical protein
VYLSELGYTARKSPQNEDMRCANGMGKKKENE